MRDTLQQWLTSSWDRLLALRGLYLGRDSDFLCLPRWLADANLTQHLLITGEAASGATPFLRDLLRQQVRRNGGVLLVNVAGQADDLAAGLAQHSRAAARKFETLLWTSPTDVGAQWLSRCLRQEGVGQLCLADPRQAGDLANWLAAGVLARPGGKASPCPMLVVVPGVEVALPALSDDLLHRARAAGVGLVVTAASQADLEHAQTRAGALLANVCTKAYFRQYTEHSRLERWCDTSWLGPEVSLARLPPEAYLLVEGRLPTLLRLRAGLI